MHKRITMGWILGVMLLITGCGSAGSSDTTIATVNGVKIGQSQLDQQYTIIKAGYETQLGLALDEAKDQEIVANLKNTAYKEVIIKELVRQEAEKQGLKISAAEIDAGINNFKQTQNSSDAEGYQKFLDKLGMTEAEMRQEFEISLLLEQLQDKVAGQVKVSETDALAYYNANPDLFGDPGGIKIYHILVENQQQAEEIISKIRQGDDFAALAAQYSQDPGSKDQGGDVGTVNETTNFVPEFKQAALTLQPGQLYPQPVKTDYGYHIIKAGARQASQQYSFAEIKNQLIEQMETDQKDQAFSAYLEQLQNTAEIKDLRQNSSPAS